MLQEVDAEDTEYYANVELEVLAKTIWGETVGEPWESSVAVASLIMNRFHIAEKRQQIWWGNNILKICQTPYQFGCWSRNKVFIQEMRSVNTKDDERYAACLVLAKGVIAGGLVDTVEGSTHFCKRPTHPAWVTYPYWTKAVTPTITVGNLNFYKLENRG